MELYIEKINATAITPEYAHTGDAGMDLFTNLEFGDVVIEAGARALITTGIKVAIPEGCVGLIWDKSGLAVKHGLTVLGGVIDSGYRGEIMVCVVNLGKELVVVRNGQKIAQMIVQPYYRPLLKVIQSLPESTDGRQEGGFGSTGV